MTVGRIRGEAALASFVAPARRDGRPDLRADRPAGRDAPRSGRRSGPWPGRSSRRRRRTATEGEIPARLRLIAAFAGPFVRTYLWPLGLILAVVFAVRPRSGSATSAKRSDDLSPALMHPRRLPALIGLALFYARLRKQEQSDWTDERAADRRPASPDRRRARIAAPRTTWSRSPSASRAWSGWFTLRLVFWLIAQLREPGLPPRLPRRHRRPSTPRAGSPSPGTPRLLVFFSNYGGSWESYLEDFITRAHAGLTGGLVQLDRLPARRRTCSRTARPTASASSATPARAWRRPASGTAAYPELITDA